MVIPEKCHLCHFSGMKGLGVVQGAAVQDEFSFIRDRSHPGKRNWLSFSDVR